MDLQNAFNTIVNTVAVTPLTKQERITVEEALQVMVINLNSFDALKKQVKKQTEGAAKKSVPEIVEEPKEQIKDKQ